MLLLNVEQDVLCAFDQLLKLVVELFCLVAAVRTRYLRSGCRRLCRKRLNGLNFAHMLDYEHIFVDLDQVLFLQRLVLERRDFVAIY